MDYFVLEAMRRSHPAWRLLAADHAPLIAAFLYQSFVQPNVRTLAQQAIASRLEDLLYQLRERLGELVRLEQERIGFGWFERALHDAVLHQPQV